MDYIKYDTTLKACGDEYKRIVFWNRFIRNPVELILTWIPAVITIVLISLGYVGNTFIMVIYAACWFYPLYIFGFQFKSNINYHLKHRDPSESALCHMTLTESCILADIPEYELTHSYNWEDFTTVYDKFGYYMFFSKSKMLVMLRKADMSKEQLEAAPEFIKKCIDMNICRVLF